jgi:hypothetical protein
MALNTEMGRFAADSLLTWKSESKSCRIETMQTRQHREGLINLRISLKSAFDRLLFPGKGVDFTTSGSQDDAVRQ